MRCSAVIYTAFPLLLSSGLLSQPCEVLLQFSVFGLLFMTLTCVPAINPGTLLLSPSPGHL